MHGIVEHRHGVACCITQCILASEKLIQLIVTISFSAGKWRRVGRQVETTSLVEWKWKWSQLQHIGDLKLRDSSTLNISECIGERAEQWLLAP